MSEKSVSDAPMKNPHGNASAVIEGGVMKTPRTVTKRRSFIPTPGGIVRYDFDLFVLLHVHTLTYTPVLLQNCY